MRELTAVGKFLEVADIGSSSLECNQNVKGKNLLEIIVGRIFELIAYI